MELSCVIGNLLMCTPLIVGVIWGYSCHLREKREKEKRKRIENPVYGDILDPEIIRVGMWIAQHTCWSRETEEWKPTHSSEIGMVAAINFPFITIARKSLGIDKDEPWIVERDLRQYIFMLSGRDYAKTLIGEGEVKIIKDSVSNDCYLQPNYTNKLKGGLESTI